MNLAEIDVPARVRQFLSGFRSRFQPIKPLPEPVSAEETLDEFQRQQAAKLVRIWQNLKQSGGTTTEHGIHEIPSVPIDLAEHTGL